MGHKAGDNSQVLALAEGLGWPYEIKRLVYRRGELLSNLLLGPNLACIVKSSSSPLTPPWPELVITAGRRNEPVARWIQRQAGHRVRIVHLGRPWARPERFDLIVTTPQYRLPRAPNILHNTLPLHRVNRERLAAAASRWEPVLAPLPRPRIALLVGGNSGAYTLDPAKAAVLARQAEAMARKDGGSLLVTTSARTPASAADILATMAAPMHFHRWRPREGDNPYFGYLACADAFIVTGDSVSMLAEACATGKPVHVFDLADGPRAHRPGRAGKLPWWCHAYNYRFRPLSHRLGMALGPRRMVRDVGNMHRFLIEQGRIAWLGESCGQPAQPAEDTDLARAVEAVRALFQKKGEDRRHSP
ncbi:MAG TPA: nucleoside-diphosphate sugar epimerase [Gammaproteobacteria bacterium]|nr:nucleoside-diphosphate sugar epimerase [Gammaproteobacteria bacterium]